MASAEQIKSLIKSHISGDDSHFQAVAMQVAAHEARLGHGKLAKELRTMIDTAKANKNIFENSQTVIPIARPRGELASLVTVTYPKTRFPDMVLNKRISERLVRLVREQRKISKIRAHGLSPRKKLLLIGPPGTGKTMSASVLAGELGLPLFVVRLDSLITKYMGETAAKLRKLFDAIAQTRGVYLFDEFDSIGAQRGMQNDVGEIHRVLNSFLQMIEQDESDSLLIAATNHPDILDYALFRRFDDVVEYSLPEYQIIIEVLKSKLAAFKTEKMGWTKLAKTAEGLSFADIVRSCEEAMKEMIINEREKLSNKDILKPLSERKAIRSK